MNSLNGYDHPLKADLKETIAHALREDIGSGDITALLIPEDKISTATVIVREQATICGVDWFNEVFQQLDPTLDIEWHIEEGDAVEPNTLLCTLKGNARILLTGERAALNFLQTLSGTATKCAYYASLVESTGVKLLDTRKTLPGLRNAQKYAVAVGGCQNHRLGLYDAFLIKENHITACGSITAAVSKAKEIAPNKPVEVETESLEELREALAANADIIMLDNYSNEMMREASAINNGQAKLEASGGVTEETLRGIAETGVDFVSIGTLTKDCQSVDLSMRVKAIKKGG